ncbi:MAG TPA: alcohol dehydrogenase catalytic domain-containing protein [bacterium]
MRAGVYYSNSDLRIEERPRPAAGPGEIVVRIVASGVCGSDVLEWYRIKKAPLVLGHEVAGTVAEIGEGVTAWKVGDRVAVTHHVPCNTCPACRGGHHTACQTLHTTNFDPGGFTEFVRVPPLQTDRGVFRLPEGVTFEEGTFAEPLGCVVRAQRLARVGPGDAVLVMGSGISGLLHIALARALGAGTILATDVHPWRLEAARRFGAAAAFCAGPEVPAQVASATGGRMADRVIVCTGATAAVNQSMRLVASGGTVLFFGAPDQEGAAVIPFPEIWRREITLQTSYGAAGADLATALELIRARRVPVAEMITHRFPLERIGEAFATVAAGGESIKVIVEP